MFSKLHSSNYLLQDELNFERKRIPKQKRLNQAISSQIPQDDHDRVKKSKTIVEEDDEITDVTQKRGNLFVSQPSSLNEVEDDIEINLNSTIQLPYKHNEKERTTKLPKTNALHYRRSSTFLQLQKQQESLLNILNCSSSKTKTQQFMEKIVLMQKIDPQEMCKICKIDDFEKIKLLGQGACGIVEKQLFKPLSQEVAMKKYFNEEKKEEFDSEVYIMNKKQSEYIPKLVYFHKNNLSIYMELGMITLDTYERYLRRNNLYLKENFGVWILKQLILINEHMYESSYHHSDIKPSNIIITYNDQKQMKVKLIDLGAASIFPEDYWIQFTPFFQCQRLLKKQEAKQTFTRQEILYAEIFASCRSIQLLTLCRHPKRSQLFRLESIDEYLADKEIKKNYEYLLIIFQYVFKKNSTEINTQDIGFLKLLLNVYIDIKQFEDEIENSLQESNVIN